MPTSEDAASFLPYRDEVTDQYVMQSDAEREISEKKIKNVAGLLKTCAPSGKHMETASNTMPFSSIFEGKGVAPGNYAPR